jgi:hypothetical protein
MASWTLLRAKARCWKPEPAIVPQTPKPTTVSDHVSGGYRLVVDGGLVRITRLSGDLMVAIGEWDGKEVKGLEYLGPAEEVLVEDLVRQFHLRMAV